MPTRIELPDGQWAELVDDSDHITEGRRRPVRKLIKRVSARSFDRVRELAAEAEASGVELDSETIARFGATMDTDDLDLLDQLNDALLIGTLVEWSYPIPVPPTPADLLTLDGRAYDALMEASAVWLEKFMETNPFSPDPTPGSPT